MEKTIMDERQVQVSKCRSHKGYVALHPAAARCSETARGQAYVALLDEGHYRCPHCRRGDLSEGSAGARRMR
ncbi:MAG: hypothetical protein FJ280_22460 [Planctomycetes bacterium]|nr:hypothetical protein [Planctomycetota bacterium]